MELKFWKKITSFKEVEEPKGYFWLIIIFLLLAMGFSIMFFSRNQDYDLSVLTTSLSSEIERQPRVYSVSYRGGTFSPTNLRIRIGDTVRFENGSVFSIYIKSDDLPGFDSMGPIPNGGVFTFTFSNIGIFDYYNSKAEGETGRVIVRE